MKDIKLNEENFGILAMCAIRYCFGRQSYMPAKVRKIIEPYLCKLSDKTLNRLIEDCGFQERYDLYGDVRIDKPGWLVWRDTLLEEQNKRNAEVENDG